MNYETIASPISYGGAMLKNRIIFSPTSLGNSPDETIEQLRRIAAGGCAMIVVGDVSVLPHGFGSSLYTRKGMAFYQKLTQAVHRENCLVCAQLHQSDSNMRAMLKYVPGLLSRKITAAQLRELLNREVGPYVTGMPVKKIRRILQGFGGAGQTGGFRFGAGPWRPHVRQFQLHCVQPPDRCLWRQL